MDEPIRVAHVIGKLNAAGVEAVVNNYYKNIDHNKYQFDYFIDSDGTCDPPEEIKKLGARYYVIPPYQKLFSHVKTLTKIFGENNYKIVHSGMNTLAPISLFCAWRAGVPIRINHNHSTAGKGELKRNLLKSILKFFSRCFATNYAACSNYAGQWMFGKRMMKKGYVKIFNNAIDVDNFGFDQRVRDQMREDLNIKDKYVIGHVGRFCKQKNHKFLIDIFDEYHKDNPNSILMLVGTGPLMPEIKELVKNRGLCNDVLFMGVRNDINKLYQAMDIFVLPSIYEGLPVVGVEAQASGVPCLFSNQMTKEIVLVKNSRMLSLRLNPKVWAKEIEKFENVKHDITREEIQRNGFDIKIEANKMTDYYDSLLRKCK